MLISSEGENKIAIRNTAVHRYQPINHIIITEFFMSRIIKIQESDIQPAEARRTEYLCTYNKNSSQVSMDLITYSEILKAVLVQYPEKLLFNMKEAASALNVSQEFIRKKISQGLIRAVTLGDRKLISVNEIARLIHEGV